MKTASRLSFIALTLITLFSCSNNNDRYHVINPESNTLQIIDAKEGILKQFKDGKVYIIDFEKNELKIVKLVSDESAK
jgi:hypothetical protein